MNQVAAVVGKTIKEFFRERMVLFWTYAVPLFFLTVLPLMFGEAPAGVIGNLKGGLTITMVTFMVMTAGQSNLPGSVATDRERGLYLKMASMPVSPWKEGVGRIIAVWVTSLVGTALLLVVGALYGAEFGGGFLEVLASMGFSLLTSLASMGVGLIIASLVRGESAATHTGVAITLLTYFIGMALPYSNIPEALQLFAKLHPISSANASVICLIVGEAFVGYNPLKTIQVALTVSSSILIFFIGLASYSRLCWRKD